MERFNRTFCHEVLDACVFESLDQAREISAEWMWGTTKSGPMTRWTGCPGQFPGPHDCWKFSYDGLRYCINGVALKFVPA